jgi:hypothetical protein
MKSPNYEARTGIEIEEFARNMAGNLLALTKRFNPDELVFALDGASYWRYAAYDKHYDTHCEFYKERVALKPLTDGTVPYEDVFYMVHDTRHYRITYNNDLDKYLVKKLVKAETAELNQKLNDKKSKIAFLDEPSPKLKALQPAYKGNRTGLAWVYETPKDVFKELTVNLAHQMAKTFGAKVIQVREAEADDIAYVYDVDNSPDDKVFVTTDTDWHQLLRQGVFLKFYNPTMREWVDKTPETARKELAIKIMSGDSGDNIFGTWLKGGTATLPAPNKKNIKANKTELLAIEHGDGIYKFLAENADPDTLRKNYQMVYLANCPQKVQKDIRAQLKKPKANEVGAQPLSAYGLTDEDVASISLEASTNHDSDVKEGHYA